MPVAAEQDVAGFDVAVDDLLAVEIGEAVQHAFGDLPEHLFTGSPTELLDFAIDAVKGAAFTEFHGDGDCGSCWVLEGAVVSTDVLAGAVFVELSFSEDLFFNCRVGVRCDNLARC